MSNVQKIQFPQHPLPEFFPTLRTRLADYFKKNELSKNGNSSLVFKGLVMLFLYIGLFLVILTVSMPGWLMLVLCFFMGLGAAGLGMNVMHDAQHGSYSKNKILNQILGHSIEMLGGSTLTWKIQHNNLHHTFTNIYGHDEDIHDKPFLRLSPDGKWKPYHRFQHLYAFFLYGLSTISWVLKKDFSQYKNYNEQGLIRQIGAEPKWELVKLVFSKIAYLAFFIALPMIVLPFAWYWILLGYLVMQFTAGLILTCVFLTAHAVEDASHFLPDEKGSMENNWAIHQLRTTSNFKVRNPLFHWYVGGLNHQVEHHLFPSISHVHYPKIAKIVRDTAAEFSIPYLEYPSFFNALYSHAKYLKAIGARP
jgi:linoleoyl-CoA desaturase